MAARTPAGLTAREGRRFAFSVGGALVVLAAAAGWRQHPIAAAMLAAAGGTLALAGLVVPARLGGVERGWMALAHAISRITTPIVMAGMYLGVLMPVGLLRCALGGNPLVHREHEGSFWRERPEGQRRTGSMRRQF